MSSVKLDRLRRRVASAFAPLRDARRIYILAGAPPADTPFSAYPLRPRKDIVRDLIRWRLRHGEVTTDFFMYGLERQVGRTLEDFVPYHVFKRARNLSNRDLVGREDYNYACLLKDKVLFAQLADSLGHRTPRNLGLLTEHAVDWFSPRRQEPLERLWDADTDLDAFCKPLAGSQGQGAFSLRAAGGRVAANGREVSPDGLSAMLMGRSLLQERVIQHPALSALYDRTVNTVRLITVAETGGPRPFAAALRMGALGGEVDNWTHGGMVSRINMKTGRLAGVGFFKKGHPHVDVHPDSGVVLDGFEVPYFAEAVAAACRLHEDLYGFHSIGWDIAITPAGPTIIEGNDGWGGYIPAVVEPGFMRSYLALFDSGGPRPHRHGWAVGL